MKSTRDYSTPAAEISRWRSAVGSIEECWRWQGTIDTHGYGIIRFAGRSYLAHRVFYTAIVGPVDPSLDLDHLCRVRDCVNPHHLEPVTSAENVMRGVGVGPTNAVKTECVHGHTLADAYVTVDRKGRTRRDCRTCVLARKSAAARRRALARADGKHLNRQAVA